MNSATPVLLRHFGGFALGKYALAALGLVALAPAAHAQTQDLFVANRDSGTISRYAGTGAGTFSTTSTTFATGLNSPQGLAFDARGNLFAANSADNSITEFASAGAGNFAAGKTFAAGGSLSSPSFLAFSPVPPPA